MLPPLVRKTTSLPPPLTGPLTSCFDALPWVTTGKSLCTLPPEVWASRLNADFSGARNVTPPPVVDRFTSSGGDEKLAEIEPPEVLPSTFPFTLAILIPPPAVSTRTGPRKSFAEIEPPDVRPSNEPPPPVTLISAPLVSTLSAPSQSTTSIVPPDVCPRRGPRKCSNLSAPPL